MSNIITYIGATEILSSLGYSVEKNVDSILEYKSGLATFCADDVFSHDYIAGKIDDRVYTNSSSAVEDKSLTRFESILVTVVSSVLQKSGLSLAADDSLLIISSTKGNIDSLQDNTEIINEDVYLHHTASKLGSFFGAKHKPLVISNACISGISSQIVASRLLRSRKFTNIVVAGADCFTKFVISGFASFKSLSSKPCRPYDINHDGLSLGEAAGAMLITVNENLSCGVVLEGGAITNDANHISGPSRTGAELCLAIEQAMAFSALKSSDISFVNAHGTATLYSDQMESKALTLAKLSDVPLNSLKGYFGHTLGAAGVIETILCVEQLRRGIVFASLGFSQLGVDESLNISAEHRNIQMKRAVKTASGFGGCNAAIVLALEEYAKEDFSRNLENDNVSFVEDELSVIAECFIESNRVVVNGNVVFGLEPLVEFSAFIRAAFKNLAESNLKFYKMDDLCKLGYVAAQYLLAKQEFEARDIAIILANSSSSLDSDVNHQNLLIEGGDDAVSPAVFVYTLPNVVLGELCIKHKINGENTFFITSQPDMCFMKEYALQILKNTPAKKVIFGWCEEFKQKYKCQMMVAELKNIK